MKRLVIAALLAICMAAAPAQPVEAIGPCTSSSAPPGKPASAAPFAMPKGYPYSMSTCTPPVIGWSRNGWALGWGCRDGSRVYLATYAVRHAAITADMATSFAAIPFSADPRAAAQAHWARYATEHFLGMADVWCEPAGTDWRPRFNAAVAPLFADAAAPPGPIWRTPTAGAGTLYRVTNGRRTSIITGRTAPGGAACDCRNPIVYLTGTFCPLADGQADEVTLCRQSTP